MLQGFGDCKEQNSIYYNDPYYCVFQQTLSFHVAVLQRGESMPLSVHLNNAMLIHTYVCRYINTSHH